MCSASEKNDWGLVWAMAAQGKQEARSKTWCSKLVVIFNVLDKRFWDFKVLTNIDFGILTITNKYQKCLIQLHRTPPTPYKYKNMKIYLNQLINAIMHQQIIWYMNYYINKFHHIHTFSESGASKTLLRHHHIYNF